MQQLLRACLLVFLQYLAPGVAMGMVAFIGSLFQHGARVEYIRFVGLAILLILAAVGAVRAIWLFLSNYRKLTDR